MRDTFYLIFVSVQYTNSIQASISCEAVITLCFFSHQSNEIRTLSIHTYDVRWLQEIRKISIAPNIPLLKCDVAAVKAQTPAGHNMTVMNVFETLIDDWLVWNCHFSIFLLNFYLMQNACQPPSHSVFHKPFRFESTFSILNFQECRDGPYIDCIFAFSFDFNFQFRHRTHKLHTRPHAHHLL